MTNVVGLICFVPVAIFAPVTQLKRTVASAFVASWSRSNLADPAMYPQKAFVLGVYTRTEAEGRQRLQYHAK